MALVESVKLNENWRPVHFILNDPLNTSFSSSDLMGSRGLVIVFTCNHCPYAKAIWTRLINVYQTYQKQGINMVAINPNINPRYPEDSPEKMLDLVKDLTLPFPYLVDAEQLVAKAYQAQCTPDIYVLNSHFNLFYHGRLDDSWQDPNCVKEASLEQALSNLCRNKALSIQQVPSMGCSIKWC